MLAYVFWHRPASGVRQDSYERSLARFHHSLSANQPAGFVSSATLRAPELPWLEPVPGSPGPTGYEDWYLVENWTAIGVLEAAAVSRGHAQAHDRAAHAMGSGAGAIYRLIEGEASPGAATRATWVTRSRGSADARIADLLEDGYKPGECVLFERCLALGPAPELCLLGTGGSEPAGTGVAGSRLPAGWHAAGAAREPLAG